MRLNHLAWSRGGLKDSPAMRILPVMLLFFLIGCQSAQTNDSGLGGTDEFVSDETVNQELVEFETRSNYVMEESLICEPADKMALMRQNLKYSDELDFETLGERLLADDATNLEKVRLLRKANRTLADWADHLVEAGCFQ